MHVQVPDLTRWFGVPVGQLTRLWRACGNTKSRNSRFRIEVKSAVTLILIQYMTAEPSFSEIKRADYDWRQCCLAVRQYVSDLSLPRTGRSALVRCIHGCHPGEREQDRKGYLSLQRFKVVHDVPRRLSGTGASAPYILTNAHRIADS